jgi:hypothetical protein
MTMLPEPGSDTSATVPVKQPRKSYGGMARTQDYN